MKMPLMRARMIGKIKLLISLLKLRRPYRKRVRVRMRKVAMKRKAMVNQKMISMRHGRFSKSRGHCTRHRKIRMMRLNLNLPIHTWHWVMYRSKQVYLLFHCLIMTYFWKEKLEQAVSDYSSAVALKSDLLPISSRQIAEVHYKLCIVYDMTSGRLAHAIEHAKKAEASVQARLDEITARLKMASTTTEVPQSETKVDVKGKGKATSNRIGSELSLEKMTKVQLESELKELQELLEDVSLKVSHCQLHKSLPTTDISPTKDRGTEVVTRYGRSICA